MNPQISGLWGGDAGIFQTVYMMKELANKAYLHPWIRERAAKIVNGCQRDSRCEDYALSNYLRVTIQYVRDPVDTEALHDPVTFYEQRLRRGLTVFGDCDDMSTYLAALLKSIGHQPYFRVLARTGNDFHHVHILCHNNLLDPTMKAGTFPAQASRAMQIKV